MSEILNLSRRDVLKGGLLAGGGLVLGVYVPEFATAADAKTKTFAPNAFVRIGSDEIVTVVVNHTEMGQGPFTTVPMLVAEELDADWKNIRFQAAPVNAIYNHAAYGMQMTGGSSSTWSEWDRVRMAGAAARLMLIEAAAKTWKVDAKTCHAESGQVIHKTSGKKLSFGKLAEAAAELKPPVDAPLKDPRDFKNLTLKDPKDYKIIGKPTRRLDTPQKIDGSAQFGIDVKLPGLLTAVIARPPVFGGKVKSFKADKAKAVPGVKDVVQIDRGIAVVADGFWAAKQGRDQLEIEWDDGELSALDTAQQGKEYAKLAEKPGVTAKKEGDVEKALADGAKQLTATYELPYLAHASMEPINCTADVRDDHCEIWTGTQFQTVDRDAAVKETALKPEQVDLHTTLAGGGFGRRAVADAHFVVEAVQVSKAVKKPVKVIWTREDDMRGGFYRPRAAHYLTAALDKAGKLVAWQQKIVCQSIIAGTPFENLIKEGIDDTAVEGARELSYDVPNLLVDWHQAPVGVPTLWWRSVGHSHTAFAVESFVDELAHAAGQDPFEFRRAMLGKRPRHLKVLELAAEKGDWGKPLPAGRGRGIAVHESFGSFVAHVIEVTVSKDGKLKVDRVVGAVDCGPPVNPNLIKAQVEGGAVFGLTAALYDEITFENGRVKQRNFHDYPMLRINEMPQVEAHIVDSKEKMGGIGEPGVPPIAPALCNAIFAATGKRIRRLPIRAEDLKPA